MASFVLVWSILLVAYISLATARYDAYDRPSPYKYDRNQPPIRDFTPKITRVYHYDNLSDCEAVCAVKCETTQVIRNDVEERQQHSCRHRKPPLVSRFVGLSMSGTMSFLVIAAVIFVGLILILCCCCCRCLRCCSCKSCCKKEPRHQNSSNDPLFEGGFREILDSNEVGYLKKESPDNMITV